MQATQLDLNDNILNYSKLIWEGRIFQSDIDSWLSNFKDNPAVDERLMALELLNAFIFYNEKEIKYLCKNVYNEFKQSVIHDLVKSGLSIHESEKIFSQNIDEIRFAHVGRPSESGCFILYYFRQENEIPVDLFIERWEQINNTIKYLVLVDDFLGTGDTIDSFLGSNLYKDIKMKSPAIKIFYIPLIALQEGYNFIHTKYPKLEVLCSQFFSNEYSVFSEKSYLYSAEEPEMRRLKKEVCRTYGNNLETKDWELGFNESQVLIGFHHNVPDNTLPVIWSEKNGWFPIFHRKTKKTKYLG